jgi:hypothetical protein
MNDRSDNPQYHPLILSYNDNNGTLLSMQAKTRGHFRRTNGNCTYPPLLLQFTKNDTLSSSIFSGQNKLKLVMPCRGDDYVVREWLVYKIYNLITPKSFRARLVSIELNDTKRKKITPHFLRYPAGRGTTNGTKKSLRADQAANATRTNRERCFFNNGCFLNT